MSYYRQCPHCGDNLDPQEICGCQIKKAVKCSTCGVIWKSDGDSESMCPDCRLLMAVVDVSRKEHNERILR